MDLREKIEEAVDEWQMVSTNAQADAVMGVVEAHARALEDENQRMRDEIASRIVEEERAVQRKILKDPANPALAGLLVGLQRSRDIVTSPAREIAEEEK